MSPAKPSRKTGSYKRDPRTHFEPGSKAETAFDNKLAALEAGDLVRAWRRSAPEGELTQKGLAARLGVTQARVSAIESARGAEGPSYATLKKIAFACGHAWPLAMMQAGREAEEGAGRETSDNENIEPEKKAKRRTLSKRGFELYIAKRKAMFKLFPKQTGYGSLEDFKRTSTVKHKRRSKRPPRGAALLRTTLPKASNQK